ncbi:hypothetical protein [Hymenobacter translucens]|uniref:hypothetical protein n=1 Tax=Hymenobacter translucens TaxID=2886507 RepID=UPI001D0EF76C|nr:hypothetical protein [Hymenobacter translucens]
MLVFLLVALVAGGYSYYRQQTQQQSRWIQLQQLEGSILDLNEHLGKAAEDKVKNIQRQIERNGNQPAELAVLQTSQQVRDRTRVVVDTLRMLREVLLQKTGNANGAPFLTHPNESATVAQVMGGSDQPGRAARLQQQLMAYATYIRPLVGSGPAAGQPADKWAATTSFGSTPVAIALARLTQLENELLSYHAAALNTLSGRVVASNLTTRMVPMAAAESNVVAYGSTYKARLGLVSVLSNPTMTMTANGRPVPVTPEGYGEVQFVVPAQKGRGAVQPAYWTGTITVKISGRDSTFQVKVPYRIAGR